MDDVVRVASKTDEVGNIAKNANILSGSADDVAEAGAKVGVVEGSLDSTAYHTVDDAKKAQSVLNGIDISYTSPESRFERGFYVSAEGDTTVAELAYHGADAKYSIRYDMKLDGQKILDLTNPSVGLGMIKHERYIL